jgi:steroid delta-isomerase-like uncharacterized protein
MPMTRDTTDFARVQGSVDANKTVARRLAQDIFSSGDMRVFDELIADGYINHNIPVPEIPGTKDGFRQLVLETRRAFPDVQVHIEGLVAEDDFVVFRDTAEATSVEQFFGVPANGKRLKWTEIHWLRVRDDQIVEHWTNFDQLGILTQLGAIPAR